ncbi:TPA: hypothetical protein HA265_07450 [Candidatus Woesearchaeota archaeon]|nr:hypothetical protein [Candidatus Woesearchaeota archaeon]
MGAERYVGTAGALLLIAAYAGDSKAMQTRHPGSESLTQNNPLFRVENKLHRTFNIHGEQRTYSATISSGVNDKYLLLCEEVQRQGKTTSVLCVYDGGPSGIDTHADRYFYSQGKAAPQIYLGNPASKLNMSAVHQHNQKFWNDQYFRMLTWITKNKQGKSKGRKK